MPNYQARTPQHGTPMRLPQRTGQPPQNDFRVGEVRNAPVVALALSDVMDADRLLDDSAEIDFVDGGPKASLSFTLKTTGIAPATYGAALKIPVITFDAKGRATLASEVSLGTAAALDSDNDSALTANSAARLATQFAVKAYIDGRVTGVMTFKGDIDCSANPNYPAGTKGESYVASVGGKIGGASGKAVDAGDLIICRATNAGGTEAAVGASWFVLEHNLAGALLAANNLADVTNPATARGNLGLAIGSDVQAYDTDLAAIAALATTAFGRAFLALADQASALTHIGAAAASNFATGTWVPVVTAASGALTSYTASGIYTRIGRVIIATVSIDISNNGSGAVALNVSLPVANNPVIAYYGQGREGTLTGNMLQAGVDPSGTSALVLTYGNGYPGGTGARPSFTIIYSV